MSTGTPKMQTVTSKVLPPVETPIKSVITPLRLVVANKEQVETRMAAVFVGYWDLKHNKQKTNRQQIRCKKISRKLQYLRKKPAFPPWKTLFPPVEIHISPE